MTKLQYAAAVQDNGPNYFVISTGKWHAPVVAKCDREEDAKRLVHADNNHDALVAALKANTDALECSLRVIEALEKKVHGASAVMAQASLFNVPPLIDQARTVLAAAQEA